MEASSSTTIDVKWSAPAEPNGVIQNYLIEYGTSPNHQPSEKEVTNRTFQLTLTGLEKFTTYYIKVRGKTSKKGNASEVLNATTFEDRKDMFFFFLICRCPGYAFLFKQSYGRDVNLSYSSIHVRTDAAVECRAAST